MKAIKEIVDTVSDKLSYSTPDFDKDLVGMRVRLQELEALLEIGSPDVRMVGIWGIGGSGKTTIASSLHMKIFHRFQSHCIVNDIGTETSKNPYLTNLQEKIISGLLKKDIGLHSVAEGKQIISTRLSHRNVLIILDDVDDIDQLDALVGSHDWFGPGSRIIITTRNEQLLISHKVDHVCQVTLLLPEEAIQLFSKRVYNKNMHVKDYEELSKSVVSYCAGLPLALKILGSFLCGKDDKLWRCTLDRLKRIPEEKIVEKLRISYDGLKAPEKQLFLDIACFFRWKNTLATVELFEACGYDPIIGIKVLKQKGLITLEDDIFDMHDLVQEMGHYIVKGDYPNNPEKHTRVWEYENLMLLEGATEENDTIEAIKVARNYSSYGVCKIISKLKKLRWLKVTPNDINYNRLSKLTRLKLLNLSHCDQLVELPELPSSLAILNADRCPKLKAIGDSHKHNKWLCQVSLTLGATINDVHKLLESMLQGGNAVENQNILLELGGVEIAKGFGPLFFIGSKYTLQLTEDWCNKFSGFLICIALYGSYMDASISMERVMSGMESEDGEAWEEGDSREQHTQVWYVSFASLRHTKWWDETCNKAVSFSGHINLRDHDHVAKSGFGVRLVARKSGSGPTAQEESEFSHYTPKFCIMNDSANALGIRLTKSEFPRYFVR
ncbi:hypothetical protein SSX86_016105 [Deinandra increscens subsp. villosa]|uniref:NB-ARC domain-containing protein n=1 Tax=Deinandra increscens subsp. villosa TaxID=3103831 RepID=A0AAP0GVC4_9ASTR